MEESPTPHAEAERIRSVYEARHQTIPWMRYSVSEPGALFQYQQRTRHVIRMLARARYFPLAQTRILDVGCGAGGWLVDFESWGARRGNLAGIDINSARVGRARERLPDADVREGDGQTLPWNDGAFDLVVQSMAFTSILDDGLRTRLAREMARVLAPSGSILWYDFFRDNPRNADVRKVTASELRRLFPGFEGSLMRVTLAPPVARRLVRRAWLAGQVLETMKLLNTHHLGLLLRSERAVES